MGKAKRNSKLIDRHPWACADSSMWPMYSGYLITDELIEDIEPLKAALCKICEEMFVWTPLRDDLCEECQK
jgi:hypothetical protein